MKEFYTRFKVKYYSLVTFRTQTFIAIVFYLRLNWVPVLWGLSLMAVRQCQCSVRAHWGLTDEWRLTIVCNICRHIRTPVECRAVKPQIESFDKTHSNSIMNWIFVWNFQFRAKSVIHLEKFLCILRTFKQKKIEFNNKFNSFDDETRLRRS